MSLTRIIWHWTAGGRKVSEADREHYHYIVAGNGTVEPGDHSPADNLHTSDGRYAAHTRGCNTGSIGVAVAGMMDARERPFSPGPWPMTEKQIEVLVGLTASLIREHGIKLSPTTVLSHAEVQPVLSITQRGKWDISWLPGMNAPGDPVGVGNILRGRVADFMKKAGN